MMYFLATIPLFAWVALGLAFFWWKRGLTITELQADLDETRHEEFLYVRHLDYLLHRFKLHGRDQPWVKEGTAAYCWHCRAPLGSPHDASCLFEYVARNFTFDTADGRPRVKKP